MSDKCITFPQSIRIKSILNFIKFLIQKEGKRDIYFEGNGSIFFK